MEKGPKSNTTRSGNFLGNKIFFFIALLVGLFLPSLLFYFPISTELKLVVDAEIDRGSVLAVFLNGDYNRSRSLPIKAGERTSYTFDNVSEKIVQLRLDPTDVPDAHFKIYKIRVLKNNVPVFEQSGDTLALSGVTNAVIESKNQDYVQYKSTSNDPIINGNFTYTISWFDKLLLKIGITAPDFALNFTWACLGLILIFGLMRWREPSWEILWPILLIPLLAPLEYYASKFALEFIKTPLPIQKSVGASSYAGFPKTIEIWTFLIMVGIAVAFGICAYFLMKKRSEESRSENHEEKFSFVFSGAICLSIFIGSFPQLKALYDQLPLNGHAADWDSQAILSWQYAANKGLIPYKDYWFPYGGFWDMLSPFPWDLLRFHIYKFIAFSVFSVSIYVVTGHRKIWALGILFATLCFVEMNYFQGLYRYVLSIDVLLFYLCLLLTRVNSVKWYIAYGLFTGWVFFYEPTQIFYPAVPVITLFILDLINKDRNRSFSRKIALHSSGFCVLIGAMAAYLAKLVYFEQLDGWLSFYAQMSAMSASSSTPGALTQWSTLLLYPENIVHLGTLFLIMWGVYLVLFQKNRSERKHGYIVLSFGLLAMMVFLKHIVRPHMAQQFIVIHFLGVLLFLCTYSSSWNKAQKIAGSLMLGGFIGFANQSGLLASTYSSYVRPLSSLDENVETLFIDGNKMQAQQDAFFAPKLFTEKSPAAKAIYDYLIALKGPNSIPNFYVLGDDLYIYVMTGKRTPPYTSVYDGGPIEAQKTNLAWLKETQPELVIWNSELQAFDGVPNVIRIPLLFQYVISNYQYKDKVDKFFILEKKQEGARTDLDFWAKNLGNTVGLIHLVKGSSYPKLASCSSNQSEKCADFLVVHIDEPQNDKGRSIELEVAGKKWLVDFTETEGVHDYHIYLDRLWFWGVSEKEGASLKIASKEEPGIKWKISYKEPDPSVLY